VSEIPRLADLLEQAARSMVEGPWTHKFTDPSETSACPSCGGHPSSELILDAGQPLRFVLTSCCDANRRHVAELVAYLRRHRKAKWRRRCQFKTKGAALPSGPLPRTA